MPSSGPPPKPSYVKSTEMSRASFMRSAFAAGVALVAGGAAASCSSHGGATAQNAQQELRYNLGGPVAAFWPMYVANELGYLNQAGITSPLVVDPTNGVQQLLSGDIQGYGSTTDVIALAATKGAPLVGIAGLPRAPYDLVVNEKIKKFEDLRGQKIGVATHQGGSAAIMRKVLRSAGFADDEYELVLTGAAASKISALQSGAIAAAMFMAPQSVDIVRKDDRIHRLGSTADVISAPMITSWMSDDWASNNQDLVVDWLSAQLKATQWLSDTQNREQASKILSKHTEVDLKACETTYDRFASGGFFNSAMSVDFRGLDEFLNLVAETGVGPFKPAEEYFDMSYLDAARST